MSSNDDDHSDEDEKPVLSPSAYLQAPSSSQTVLEQSGQHQDDGHPRTDRDEEASEHDYDSDEDRENRFTGPASTWRGYTADERALAASLDQERANNLSIHLYNSHALKTRLYDADTAARAKPWLSKTHWMARDENGKLPWHPDQHWTAWPLPAEDVPRKGEGFCQDPAQHAEDAGTFRKTEAWRPSADLSEELQAIMLRSAKQKSYSRSSVPARNGDSRSQSSQPTSRPVSAASSRRSSDAGSATSTGSAEALGRGRALLRTVPAILTDDDQSKCILGPPTSHVLSKLDNLLTDLHKSRQNSASNQLHGQDATVDRKPQKRKRASTVDLGADRSSADKMNSKRDHEKHPSGSHQSGLRDWSEVLGMAALTGWDQSIVDRAAKRCAILFGEIMSLRVMPEAAASTSADRVIDYMPTQIPTFDMSDEDDDADEDVASGRELSCPEETCHRHQQPFEQRWRLREHMKKAHGYHTDELDAMDLPASRLADVEDDSNNETTGAKGVAKESGAVHPDGFLQPIEVSFGRGRDIAVRKTKRKKIGLKPQQSAEGDAEAGAGP